MAKNLDCTFEAGKQPPFGANTPTPVSGETRARFTEPQSSHPVQEARNTQSSTVEQTPSIPDDSQVHIPVRPTDIQRPSALGYPRPALPENDGNYLDLLLQEILNNQVQDDQYSGDIQVLIDSPSWQDTIGSTQTFVDLNSSFLDGINDIGNDAIFFS